MTVEEYFQLEENDPDTRYEYIDGHVYAMAERLIMTPSNQIFKEFFGTFYAALNVASIVQT